jgi:dynein heavy chain, axonemal
VTHFLQDEGSEFTQLDQFEREHYLFSQICKLRFFQQFWMAKMFTTWRRNLRACKMSSAQDRLRESLFILHPVLRGPLLQLHDLSVKAENFNLYDMQSTTGGTKPYTLDQFCDAQVAKADRTKIELDEIFQDQMDVAFDACETTLNKFLIDNHFHTTSEAANDGGSNNARARINSSGSHSSTGANNNNNHTQLDERRLVSEDNVITVSFTERAAMRTQCKKLVKFVRLVDLFTVHAYLKSARSSIAYLMGRIRDVDANAGVLAAEDNAHVESDDESVYEYDADGNVLDPNAATATSPNAAAALVKHPLFVVEMDYEVRDGNSELRFMPVAKDFKRRVERAVVGNLQVLSSRLPRLLTHPRFSLFVQPTIDEYGPFGEGADIEGILLDESSFNIMLDTINQRMNDAFACADTYAQSFAPFLEVYVRNLEVFEGLTFDNYKNAHYDIFRDCITKHQEEVQMFQKIPECRDVSFIQVNSDVLKKSFSPSPMQCLRVIAQLLPEIASLRNTSVNQQVTDAHDIAAHEPFNVAEFHRLCTFLEGFDERMIEMTQSHIFASEMYKLLGEFNIRTTERQQTEHFMLEQSWQALLDALETCEDTHKSRKAQFIKELAKLVPKLNERTDKVRMSLEHDMIRSPEVSSGEVLDYLDRVQETLNIETDTAKKYNSYQQLMGIPVLPWDDLEAITVDLNLKLKLWTTIQQWERSSKTWLSAIYDAIDADEVSKQMNIYRKTVQQCEYGLADEERPNLAIPKLRAAVMEFHSTLPVVADLRCPALRERHWEQINDLLKFELNPSGANASTPGGNSEELENSTAEENTKADKVEKQALSTVSGRGGDEGDAFTLGLLMQRNIKKYGIEINTIATTAKAEAGLETMLDKLVKIWKKLEFEIFPYKQRKNMWIIGSTDDVLTVLDDSMVTVSTLLGSRYVGPIQPQVEDWHQKLTKFNETLEAWTSLQRNWAYLENIFNGPVSRHYLLLVLLVSV